MVQASIRKDYIFRTFCIRIAVTLCSSPATSYLYSLHRGRTSSKPDVTGYIQLLRFSFYLIRKNNG